MTRSSRPGPAVATRTVTVPTPLGPARVAWTSPPGGHARGTLLLGHGAGGGFDAPDLLALAAAGPEHGLRVGRVEQPWHVAGKPIAPAPARLDEAWRAVVARCARHAPLLFGGRSAGARVARRVAAEPAGVGSIRPVAVVALAFPLHPPGRPEKSRLDELLDCPVPVLVVQGERDPFGRPGEFPAGTELRTVPGADHGFAVAAATVREIGRDQRQLLQDAAVEAVAWCVKQLA
jgi:predicted alpha/beta-hydrolase family hydrolase